MAWTRPEAKLVERTYRERAWRCGYRFDYHGFTNAEVWSLRNWCVATLDSHWFEGRWEHQSMSSGPWGQGGWIGFRDPSDAVAFKLRWC